MHVYYGRALQYVLAIAARLDDCDINSTFIIRIKLLIWTITAGRHTNNLLSHNQHSTTTVEPSISRISKVVVHGLQLSSPLLLSYLLTWLTFAIASHTSICMTTYVSSSQPMY